MKRTLSVVLLALMTPWPSLGNELGEVSPAGAKSATAGEKRDRKREVEEILRTMTGDLIQAYTKHETALLDRIFADDLIVVNPDGTIGDKAGEIEGLKTGKLQLESVTNDDMKVRVYGETAVVTGRATIKGLVDGREVSDQNRYTSVFVKRRGRWQVVALHITRVPQH